MKYRNLYEQGKESLMDAGVPDAELDARLLLEHVCHTGRNDLLVHGEMEIEDAKSDRYLELIGRRSGRVPLQQLTGVQDFMGLTFMVNEHVLIPRQDTEILVEEVLKELHDGMRILDLCTGTGCVLTSLLRYSNCCEGVGVDISPEALRIARENAIRLLPGYEVSCFGQVVSPGDEKGSKVAFKQGDLFECVPDEKFEFIVSNPPYIPSEECEKLMPEVRDHEPRIALDGSEDGLFFYRKIAEAAPDYLTGGGRLYFEIGFDQANAVGQLLEKNGFTQIEVVKDYAGLDRVVYGVLQTARP